MTPQQHPTMRPLGDLGVPHGQHMCLLFADEQEQLRTIAGFFAAGRRGGHKLLYITDTAPAAEVRRRFGELGVDLGTTSGAEVKTSAEAYHPTGRFEPEAMCADLEAFAAGTIADGFAGCRCSGEMSWAARRIPGSERLLEYEAMLNQVVERLPLSGICQYDVRLFDGPTILAVIEVHPYLLVRGQILRNPNYVRRDGTRPVAPVRPHERARV
jgi:hypothetical protein